VVDAAVKESQRLLTLLQKSAFAWKHKAHAQHQMKDMVKDLRSDMEKQRQAIQAVRPRSLSCPAPARARAHTRAHR
jgi:hypothetical protein